MSEKFFNKVYDVVKRIPYGKVTTYGAIAHYLGSTKSARTVGWGKVPIAYSKEWSNYETSRAKKILENGEVKNEILHTQASRT